MTERESKIWLWGIIGVMWVVGIGYYFFNRSDKVEADRGLYIQQVDDPYTTNNESNDQPVGYFGTETVRACTTHNDTCYALDVLVEDGMVVEIYFPKGGNVDLYDGEFDGDYGWGTDENGREWEFSGY